MIEEGNNSEEASESEVDDAPREIELEEYTAVPETFIELIATRSQEVISLIDSISGRVIESAEARGRFTIRMAWLAFGMVVVIIFAAGFLTYVGKIGGSTFAFLLGLVSGYMLNFVQDSMNPSRQR